MASVRDAVYFLAVGLLLIAASAWTYQQAQAPLSLEETLQPRECSGYTFLLDPSRLVVRGEARAVGFNIGDKTLDDAGMVEFNVIISNDPCKDGYAEVIVVTPGGVTPPQNMSLDQLASALLAPEEAIASAASRGAADTSMGVYSAIVAPGQPRLRPGAFPGSFYYEIPVSYYDASTGILVKRESTWIKASGFASPDVMIVSQEVTDILRETPDGQMQSFTRSAEALAAYSLAAGLGLVAGAASLAYAVRLLLE